MADCLFCRIAAGEIPAKIAKRTADAIAFHDIDPKAPVHVLVMPTRHLAAVRDAAGADGEAMLGGLLRFAADVAGELGLDGGGYRIVTNTGRDAGQSVDHLHFHVMGGRRMTWPPG
jgi:histidine triad (HIT) family protein